MNQGRNGETRRAGWHAAPDETSHTKHTHTMKTAKILMQLINAARDTDRLRHMEVRIVRHYDNGTITARELARLDIRIMEMRASIAE